MSARVRNTGVCFPYRPERIIDNLLAPEALNSVEPRAKASRPGIPRFLISATFEDCARNT